MIFAHTQWKLIKFNINLPIHKNIQLKYHNCSHILYDMVICNWHVVYVDNKLKRGKFKNWNFYVNVKMFSQPIERALI